MEKIETSNGVHGEFSQDYFSSNQIESKPNHVIFFTVLGCFVYDLHGFCIRSSYILTSQIV